METINYSSIQTKKMDTITSSVFFHCFSVSCVSFVSSFSRNFSRRAFDRLWPRSAASFNNSIPFFSSAQGSRLGLCEGNHFLPYTDCGLHHTEKVIEVNSEPDVSSVPVRDGNQETKVILFIVPRLSDDLIVRYVQELISWSQPLNLLLSRKALKPFMVTSAPRASRKPFVK